MLLDGIKYRESNTIHFLETAPQGPRAGYPLRNRELLCKNTIPLQ